MASTRNNPGYKISKDTKSSYNLLQHIPHQFGSGQTNPVNGITVPTGDVKDDYSRQLHYKSVDDNDNINKVEYYNVSGHNNNSPDKMATSRLQDYTGAQSYRDDPRYGSATRRKQHAMDTDLNLNFDLRNEGVNSRNNGPDYSMLSPREKPWMTHRTDNPGAMVDPRTGNNHNHGLDRARLRHGGVLLFIRFPAGSGPGRTDNIGVACQSFLRSKTSDLGGKFLGIAKAVYDFGYGGNHGKYDALGVYHFPNRQKAKLFFQYDTIIRQPDFPPPYGHAEIWTISNAYLPDNLEEYNTFLLSEVMLHEGTEKREFFDVFQRPFEKFLSQNEVMPFVVCSYGSHDRECLRRHAYPSNSIVTCHLFKGARHLNWLTDQEMYLKFRSLHNQMADEKCSVFSIERDLCP